MATGFYTSVAILFLYITCVYYVYITCKLHIFFYTFSQCFITDTIYT
nr:MAG TPA: hypothetical protein [Caudoviricetes sp.]